MSEEEEKDEKTEHEQKMEDAKEEIQQLEEDPPDKLEDWPDGQAKYETFGGAEGDHSYDEGPEAKLGPDSVRHHEDGSVEVGGEKADDPDEFKGEPIPGGPTDPDAKSNPDEQRLAEDDDDERRRRRGPRGRHLGRHVRGHLDEATATRTEPARPAGAQRGGYARRSPPRGVSGATSGRPRRPGPPGRRPRPRRAPRCPA